MFACELINTSIRNNVGNVLGELDGDGHRLHDDRHRICPGEWWWRIPTDQSWSLPHFSGISDEYAGGCALPKNEKVFDERSPTASKLYCAIKQNGRNEIALNSSTNLPIRIGPLKCFSLGNRSRRSWPGYKTSVFRYVRTMPSLQPSFHRTLTVCMYPQKAPHNSAIASGSTIISMENMSLKGPKSRDMPWTKAISIFSFYNIHLRICKWV